jgi:hypothetical protein
MSRRSCAVIFGSFENIVFWAMSVLHVDQSRVPIRLLQIGATTVDVAEVVHLGVTFLVVEL